MRTLRRRRELLAINWVLLLALGLGAGTISIATFVHQDTSSGGFTGGTVTLGLTPATNLISMSGMVPSNQVSAPLTRSEERRVGKECRL